MSLADATWQEFARGANVQESWVLWLYDSNGGVLHLGDKDSSLGGYMTHGMVTDWGDIRRSIDLSKFCASVDNVTVRVTNAMYHGAKLIETIGPHTAGYKYINREVRIVSYLNGNAASEMRLYTGRLRNLKWTADEIELDIEQAQPWDFIRIPDTVDSRTQTPIPVVYGAFTANASTEASPGYANGKALWPVKVVRKTCNDLAGHSLIDPGTARLHIYEQSKDIFSPLTDQDGAYIDNAELESGESYYTVMADPALMHFIKCKADHNASVTYNDFTDSELATDTPTADDSGTTSATCVIEITEAGPPQPHGWGNITISVPATEIETDGGVDVTVRYKITETSGNIRSESRIYLTSGAGTTHDDVAIGTNGVWNSATLTISTSPVPSSFRLLFYLYGDDVGDIGTVELADVRLEFKCKLKSTSDLQALLQATSSIEHLYCSGNGLGRSWTTGSVADIHELHRDVLHRFCGHTTTPTGWTGLDSKRSGWSVRYWQHEKTDVQEILEQAQFEGAFIFVWDMTATGTGRYLLPQASYSSSDVVATIVEARDTTGLEYSHTPFEDLVTKQVISYQRHPADSRYIATWTETNATARTAWNIQTLENVEQVELDMLVDDGAVQDWASIRDNIFGDLKRIVSTTILNPRWSIIEIGDIVQFDGDARYYMVTDERRTMGRLTITAREVYA